MSLSLACVTAPWTSPLPFLRVGGLGVAVRPMFGVQVSLLHRLCTNSLLVAVRLAPFSAGFIGSPV